MTVATGQITGERRGRLLAALFLFALAIYVAATAYNTATWNILRFGFHPVEVVVEGDPAAVGKVVVGYPLVQSFDENDPIEAAWPREIVSALRYGDPGRMVWRIIEPTDEVRLHLPDGWQAGLTAVTVRSGDFQQRFDAAGLTAWPEVAAPETIIVPGAAGVRRSPASLREPDRQTINQPDAFRIAVHGVAWALGAALCLGLLLTPERFGAGRLLAAAPAAQPCRGGLAWPVGAFALLAATLAALEGMDPYYFTQDDNFSQFLPYIAYSCEVLAQGAWPDFNPYQFAGAPVASIGTYAVSYLGTWASCAAAAALGRPMAILEVFAVLHLLAAFPAAYLFGRKAGLERAGAAAVALSFVLCGYFLIAGRSWYYMLPVALWLPLLLRSALTLEEARRPLSWTVAAGLVIGLFFHAGNTQMWVYAVALWGLLLLWRWGMGRLDLRRMVVAGCGLGLGIGIALPQLLPQFAHAAQIKRVGGIGPALWGQIPALFLPFGPLGASTPNGYGADVPQLYYGGSLHTMVGFAVALMAIGLWCRRPLSGALRLEAGWPVLGLLAMLVAMGHPATLWPMLAHLPGFKYFNVPLKLVPVLLLLFNLGGALAAQRCFSKGVAAGLAGVAMALTVANALTARDSLYTYGADPYPALPPELRRLAGAGDGLGARVAAVVPYRTPLASLPFALGQNYPTAYRIPGFGGYDPLVEDTADNRALYLPMKYDDGTLLRAFGVRWLTSLTTFPEPDPAPGPGTQRIFAARWPSANLVVGEPAMRSGDVAVYDLGPAAPTAFLAGDERALPARLEAGRVVVTLPPRDAPSTVVLNFLHRSRLRVTGDGTVLATERDPFGRVAVAVPPGTQRLEMSYDGGWGKGLLFGALLSAACLAGAALAGRKAGPA